MSIDFSPCEYWLLDTVLSMYITTADLLLDDYDGINVYPFVSIFTKKEIINSFIKLFSTGYLLATRKHGDENFIPTNREIREALSQRANHKQSFFYFLTAKGGEKWESLSNPNWNAYTKFYQAGNTDKPDIFAGDIFGVSLSWIKKRLKSFLACPISPDGDDLFPIIINQQFSTVVPYQATYWKAFSKGHKISFKYKFVAQSEIDSDILISYQEDTSEIAWETYWYTHPYGEFHSEAQQILKNLGY